MLSSLALVLNCLEEMRVFFWIYIGSKLRFAVESRTDFEIATLKRYVIMDVVVAPYLGVSKSLDYKLWVQVVFYKRSFLKEISHQCHQSSISMVLNCLQLVIFRSKSKKHIR